MKINTVRSSTFIIALAVCVSFTSSAFAQALQPPSAAASAVPVPTEVLPPAAPPQNNSDTKAAGEAVPAQAVTVTPSAIPVPVPGAATTTTTTSTTSTTTTPASTATTGSALPDGGAVVARSPGMELPPEAGTPSGPAGAGSITVHQKSKEEIKAEIREDSFNAALTGLMPLEPSEIRRVLKRFDQTKEATETPIYPFPEPQSVVKNISLDPGVHPLELKLATGNVTTVTMLDATGAPWPVAHMTWAGNFTVNPPAAGSNMFVITPMSEFAAGNMSIAMVGLVTPITFVLRTHRDEVYYRVDARLPENGPYAKQAIIDQGITIEAGCPCMTAFLNGVPPDSAKKLEVTGADGRTTAYSYNGSTFVRTPLNMLSPAWSSSVKSADGMNVYNIDSAPVILLSDQGRMVRARLSERNEKKND